MVSPGRILAAAALCGAFATGALGAPGATVKVAGNAMLGRILVSGAGRTLYERAAACAGTCAARWPPLVVAAKPAAGTGARARLLGTVVRADGRRQVTYGGKPLYLFSGDRKPGDTMGEGVGGWHAVAPSGAAVLQPASSSSSSSSMGGGSSSSGTATTGSSGPPPGVNPGMWCAANPKNCVNGVPVTP